MNHAQDCGPDDRCPDCLSSAVHAPCREVIRRLARQRDQLRSDVDRMAEVVEDMTALLRDTVAERDEARVALRRMTVQRDGARNERDEARAYRW